MSKRAILDCILLTMFIVGFCGGLLGYLETGWSAVLVLPMYGIWFYDRIHLR